jgi:hypothetical protein
MKKIIVVVRDGCVESVFIDSPEKVELEIVDFDGFLSVAERQEFNDYVNACRATMKEL